LETDNPLTPEFNLAAGAEAQSSTLNKSKQYLLILALSRKQIVGETLAVSLEEKEFGDGNP